MGNQESQQAAVSSWTAAPMLGVPDVARAVTYFVDVLGFECRQIGVAIAAGSSP